MSQKKQLRPIMFVGTGSDVGKSIVNAGFCRIFKQDGYNPAPFKAQNMSLNSYATPDGNEIGRAQAVQAEACSIPCSTDMNPVLLKPTSDKTSQIVLHGKPVGSQTAADYFLGNNKMKLFEEALDAFGRLNEKHSPVVLEGAGSISEINLKQRDITNMRMALATGAATYLVADINKGGVFGSVYGTIALLDQDEKDAIKGIIINKFRGDATLFEQGRLQLEKLTNKPVVGVLPYFEDIYIDDEDSVSLSSKNKKAAEGKVNIAVVQISKMANFTDFSVLDHHPDIHLYFSDQASEIDKADIIILPGSKNTIADLKEMWKKGIAETIIEARSTNKTIIGICGGFQMMGIDVNDPEQLDGGDKHCKGLGLLPVSTTNKKEKLTQQRKFSFIGQFDNCAGYEIHMGITRIVNASENPVSICGNGYSEGYYLDENCWGTYMHGILDNAAVIDHVLKKFKHKVKSPSVDFNQYKQQQYDKLADHIRQHVDMESIYSHLSVD